MILTADCELLAGDFISEGRKKIVGSLQWVVGKKFLVECNNGGLMDIRFEKKVRLRMYLGEQVKYHHRPFYEVVFARARDEGLAGATVFRGILSYGMSGRVHSSKILELSQDLPMVVEIVEEEEKIENFLQILAALAAESGAHVHLTREEVDSALIRQQE